jgi:hypothetical protein
LFVYVKEPAKHGFDRLNVVELSGILTEAQHSIIQKNQDRILEKAFLIGIDWTE